MSKLVVRDDRTATLACDDRNGNFVYRQEFDFTFFCCPRSRYNFAGNVILLASEYCQADLPMRGMRCGGGARLSFISHDMAYLTCGLQHGRSV